MSEMEPWTRQLLSVIVSQLCKTIGWHSISTTSLQVLVDIMNRYLKQLGTSIHNHTEHFNHTSPSLEELNLALMNMGVNVEDLKEYVDYVAPIPIKMKVPLYPLEKKSNMNFLKPGSREVVTRPFHIHEHLPAMHPELPEDNYVSQELPHADNSALPILTETNVPSTMEKSGENADSIINKRLTNVLAQEVGKPARELKCVMMTTSGFLSPAIEGKMPETRIPKAVHNVVRVENPVIESATVPVVPESKSEHKKSSHSKSSSKNSEKKNRTPEENHNNTKDDNNDESKVKKVIHQKEAPKLKVPKPVVNPPVEPVPETPAIIRQEKLKIPQVVSQKEPKPPKQTKAEKKLEKMQQQQEQQQQQQVVVSEKLTTEPNKQKLNIFRRISKAKEERAESPAPKNNTDDKSASINESIENVVRNIGEKETIRNVHEKQKPSVLNSVEMAHSKVEVANPLIPGKKIKRKKKKKIRDTEPSAKKMKLNNEIIPIEVERPKSVVTEQPLPYTFFTQLPEPLETNYLIPRFTNPFLNVTKLDPNCPHPEMPNLPLPPPMMPTNFVDNRQRSPARSIESERKLIDPPMLNMSDKKLKKKMKKDKREKDKKKRDKKDKLKKDKLEEKKQDKLMRKEKNKEKLKLKKKNKLTLAMQKEEILEDPSVPKIKLRIGGTNSPLPSPSGINVSIVKPQDVGRHNEPSIKDMREQSPELAKMPALVGKPTKVKNHSKISVESSPVVPRQVVEPITLSTKGKKASVVNAETKPKNKEKPTKSKKTESHKLKPEPFYYDAEGNQVWICPTCSHPDDGSPMIGCDGCDAWYHWVCVEIKCAPESAKWFCPSCLRS